MWMVKYTLVLACRNLEHTRQLLCAPGFYSEFNTFDTTADVIRRRKKWENNDSHGGELILLRTTLHGAPFP